VMYGAINKFQTALDYLVSVNTAFNAIESLYQNFLNENPENYTVYDGNYEGFSFHIELNEASYAIEFNYKSAGIKITYDDETGTNIGKITLTDGIAAKYVIKNNFVKIWRSNYGSRRRLRLSIGIFQHKTALSKASCLSLSERKTNQSKPAQ